MSQYEVIPVRIVLPAVPTLEAKPRPLSEVRDEQVIHIAGATTLSTILSDAQREAHATLAETTPISHDQSCEIGEQGLPGRWGFWPTKL